MTLRFHSIDVIFIGQRCLRFVIILWWLQPFALVFYPRHGISEPWFGPVMAVSIYVGWISVADKNGRFIWRCFQSFLKAEIEFSLDVDGKWWISLIELSLFDLFLSNWKFCWENFAGNFFEGLIPDCERVIVYRSCYTHVSYPLLTKVVK